MNKLLYLAEVYKDYSEDEYLLLASEVFTTKKKAQEFLDSKVGHVKYIKTLGGNNNE